jgi:hypothetical protein
VKPRPCVGGHLHLPSVKERLFIMNRWSENYR